MRPFKRTYISICLALALSTCISCKDYLYVEPIGQSTIASFFYDIEGMRAAGTGIHAEMLGFNDDAYTKYAEIMGDMLNLNSVYANEGDIFLFNYRMLPSYDASYPYNIWKKGFGVITNANNILYYGPELKTRYTNDIEEINRILAYGHFARALIHFELCNCYARPYNYTPDASHIGIPVVDGVRDFESVIKRGTVKQVYDLIVSDLKEGIDLLPKDLAPEKKVYYVSQDACKALLARVYLYMEDYENAEKLSKELMDKYPLTAGKDYVNMFRSAKTNAGSEVIFRFNEYDGSSTMRAFYDPTSSPDAAPCPAIENYFEVDDVRKQLLTYIPESVEPDEFKGMEFRAVCKFLAFKSITDDKERVPDFILLRASEQYLIHAESVLLGKGDLETAANDIKSLIGRGRNLDPASLSLIYSSKEDMMTLIERERVKELCYEGHRYFDISRWKKDVVRPAQSNAEVKTLKYTDYHCILPIPRMEMQANEHMVQNEGYPRI